jgi:hypothetical protein
VVGGNQGLEVDAMKVEMVDTCLGDNAQGTDLYGVAVKSWHNLPSPELPQRHRTAPAAGVAVGGIVGIHSRIGIAAGPESKDHVEVGYFCCYWSMAEGRKVLATMDGGTGR